MANVITIVRILLVAPFVALFLTGASWSMSAALGVFVLAAATDFIDGRIARARGESSALGAALDPIADKILLAAALLLLTRNGVLQGADPVLAVAILSREFLVSGLREAVARSGETIPVTTLAKWKTTVQLAACALLIAAAPSGPLGTDAAGLARSVFWLAGALTLWTGAGYVAASVRILRATSAAGT